MSESYTKQPRFTKEVWLRACQAWDAGRFGREWADWRLLAAKEGVIFPPEGTPEDSWADGRPSQRAMIVRAIRETPRLLRWAIRRPGVASWSDVIENLLEGRDRLGLEADERERDWTLEKSRRGRPVRIGEMLSVVGDSLGMEEER